MRITYAYDVDLPNRFAATIQILATGHALAARGAEMRFICGKVENGDMALADLGIQAHPRLRIEPALSGPPRAPLLRGLFLRRRLARALAATPTDIVMSRGETGLALFAGGRTLPRGALSVFEMHKLMFLDRAERAAGKTLEPAELGGWTRKAEARAYHRAHGVVFLTEALQEAAEAAFGKRSNPTTIAPSGAAAVDPAARPEPDFDLVFAGKIERRKGLFLMIEAMRRLPGRTLRLIGAGADMGAAQELARTAGIADRIAFTGHLPHSEMARNLARGRIGLCLPPLDVDHVSTSFTSPMKLLEMMSLGMAVIATDAPSVRAICRDGVEALLVPADPSAVASAVNRLLGDPALASGLGRAARLRAAEFGWDKRAERIAAFCSGLRA